VPLPCTVIPKAGNKNTVRITIRKETGPSEETAKGVPAGSAVKVLKHILAEDLHCRESSIYLVYGSKVLQDEEQLPEDCYNGASTIELRVRAAGGVRGHQ
jgi:hypothetical protein